VSSAGCGDASVCTFRQGLALLRRNSEEILQLDDLSLLLSRYLEEFVILFTNKQFLPTPFFKFLSPQHYC